MTTGQKIEATKLHQEVQSGMEELHVPGVGLGIIHDGAEHTAGFGVTNVNHPLEVDADTLFQIGSITKTMVGTVVMRLVEQGKLDLDRPIREYLPDLKLRDAGAGSKATLRHLLTHTGGWVGDYFDDTGNGDDALIEIVRRMADLDQLYPLGEQFSYNNSGYYIAGRVIEVVTGQTFEQAFQELLLDPLGMKHSFFFPADVMVHRFAVGHEVHDGEAKVATPWPLARAAHPAGGITSSINDMLKYARFQLANGVAEDGTQLISEESLAEMRRPQFATDTYGNHVGITWMLRSMGGLQTVNHTGGTKGQIALFLLVPDRQFALAMLTNADTGGELWPRITRWALTEYLGAEFPDPTAQEMNADALQEYAGNYKQAMSDYEMKIEDGTLVIHSRSTGGFPKRDTPPGPATPPVRAAFSGKDQVFFLDAPFKDSRGEFLRNPDGSIAWFRLGSRLAKREG